jgi:hypothetical protein
VGRLGGTILKLTVNSDLIVTDRCETAALSDPKYSLNGVPAQVDILGIAFSPSDTIGRPYVSSQTLFWYYRNKVDKTNLDAWQNGRIERFTPGGGCLVFEKRVVSGLPVSDHDHGVNGIIFDNDDIMYVAVGGSTNAGLPGARFGFAYETPLSAGILKINLNAPGFNGVVTYDQNYNNHRNARKLSGDVVMHATGLRNSFDLAFTSQGEIFATDKYVCRRPALAISAPLPSAALAPVANPGSCSVPFLRAQRETVGRTLVTRQIRTGLGASRPPAANLSRRTVRLAAAYRTRL